MAETSSQARNSKLIICSGLERVLIGDSEVIDVYPKESTTDAELLKAFLFGRQIDDIDVQSEEGSRAITPVVISDKQPAESILGVKNNVVLRSFMFDPTINCSGAIFKTASPLVHRIYVWFSGSMLTLCTSMSDTDLKTHFAQSKWRTYVCAYKEITEDDWVKIQEDENFDLSSQIPYLDKILIGYTVRPKIMTDVIDEIKRFKEKGIDVVVLTSSTVESTQPIVECCSLWSSPNFIGRVDYETLASSSNFSMQEFLTKYQVICRTYPSTRADFVARLQAENYKVLYLGGTPGDGPALSKADLSISSPTAMILAKHLSQIVL